MGGIFRILEKYKSRSGRVKFLKIMKKVFPKILLAAAALATASCAVVISDESYAMASRGETVQTYKGFNSSKEALHSATLMALQERGWTIIDSGNPIKARLKKLRQEANVSIEVKANELIVDTKGSLVDGSKAYVPVRYLNNLILTIRKAGL